MPIRAKVLTMLLVWFIANFIPHIIVFLVTGKIYYQLSADWAIAVETFIMLLNLMLPVLALHSMFKSPGGILSSLGWQWNGWRTVWIGVLGFCLSLVVFLGTQKLIGNPVSAPGVNLSGHGERAALVVLLLILTAVAEETMFRGWIQTTLTQQYGVWVGIGVAALLFGLRHLPMDLYAGFSQQAPCSAWISRILQLYLGAVLFGVVRHWAKSTWASWIVHEGVLLLIVLTM